MSLKRPASAEGGTSEEVDCKVQKFGLFIKLESESEQPTDEDSESVYSFQDDETVYAKDTSDTTSHSSDSSDGLNMPVEYDVVSLSEKENPFGEGSLSSDIDDVIKTESVVVLCEEDVNMYADNSNSDSNILDPEVPRADYWTCVRCKNKNNNPMFRYCEKCFQIRKSLFPTRPRGKRKRRKDSKDKLAAFTKSVSTASTVNLFEASQDVPGPSNMHLDSGLGSSQEIFSQDSKCDTDSRELASNSGESSASLSVETCITCLTNPKNGIFIHKRVGHVCCCYKCALKVWLENGKCPICNGRVSNVLKVIVH